MCDNMDEPVRLCVKCKRLVTKKGKHDSVGVYESQWIEAEDVILVARGWRNGNLSLSQYPVSVMAD